MGKYKLHEIVGRGGMGVVYRGEHVYIGKEVAVKILHDGYGGREESIKRFLREARAASLINHPNIVDITDFGKSNDGTSSSSWSSCTASRWTRSCSGATPRADSRDHHRQPDRRRTRGRARQGIIHRDLKPENVLLAQARGAARADPADQRRVGAAHRHLAPEQAFDVVKILDFGVAKVRDPNVSEARVTQQGVVFGTPEYMAAGDGAHRRLQSAYGHLRAGGDLLRDAHRHHPLRRRDRGRRDVEGGLGAGDAAARPRAGDRDHPRGRAARS